MSDSESLGHPLLAKRTRRRPCRLASSAAQTEFGPDPRHVGSRPDPGFARWGPPLRRSASTWQRGPALGRNPNEWASCSTRSSPGGGGGAAPSTMLLGQCLSTPSPPAALSAAQAGTWTDPTRVGLRPDPDFARLGVAAPSPTLLGPYLTMPLPTGRGRRAFERGRGPASGRNPPEWAPGPTRASPGKEGLRRLARRRAGQAASGPEPTRVGSRPDPGLDRLGGAEHSPASHGPCTATPSARPRPIPSPTLRPTRHRGRSRPGRSPGLARARGPRPRSRSIVRLYAASVPGPLLNPPPPLQPGLGRASPLHGSSGPDGRADRL